VEALDRLSKTAIRYGSRGKYVFEQNQEAFLAVEALVQSLGNESTPFRKRLDLKKWLEEVPYYDPEGWSLTARLSAKCSDLRIFYKRRSDP
jgi:hypothetical protein